MKTILPEAITNVEEAKKFLDELFTNGEGYHPEDDAEDINWNLPDDQTPTAIECIQLNKLMDDIYNSAITGDFDPCDYVMEKYYDSETGWKF